MQTGHGPRSLSDICIVNAATKETKEFSIQDWIVWILMGIYTFSTCEYNFNTRGHYNTIF